MPATKQTQLAYFCLLTILISGSACIQQSPTRPASSADAEGPESNIDRVCSITADMLGVSPSSVTATTSLEELGADELDFVEIVMEIEDEFDITISDEAIGDITGTGTPLDMKEVTMKELARIVDDQKRSP